MKEVQKTVWFARLVDRIEWTVFNAGCVTNTA